MCGRYVSKDQASIERFWNLTRGGGDFFGPRYNAAPTQRLPILRILPDRGPELIQLRWGLIPSWAKDTAIGAKMINARAETVVEKPAFRAAFKRRRCLVPMAGFYEWQKTPSGKVPHFIQPLNAEMFAVAGLHEWWPGKDGAEPVETFTIITTEANEMMAKLHDRMPVILEERDSEAWLDPKNENTEELQKLHAYVNRAEDTFRVLLDRVLKKIATGDVELEPYEHGSRSKDVAKIFERLRQHAASLPAAQMNSAK
jgi:putative SOS response-associated peptidase YedK